MPKRKSNIWKGSRDAFRKKRLRRSEDPQHRTKRLNEQREISHNNYLRLTQGSEIFTESSILEDNQGRLDTVCQYCQSLNFLKELPHDKKFTSCCRKGKLHLPNNFCCELLKSLYTGNSAESKNFIENIRNFNSSLAFASMGAPFAGTVPGRGPFCYRIQGQVYHTTPPLHPEPGAISKFSQLYILDPKEASQQRMNNPENTACNRELMEKLSEMMHGINPYAKAYKMMHEVETEEKRKARQLGTEIPEIVMWITRKPEDKRYDLPATNEVAVVFKSVDGEPPFNRDICIHPRGGQLKHISILSPNCDPMIYPLFFPNGGYGWKPNWNIHGHTVTMMQYYAYKTSIRPTFEAVLHGGKLFQQYIVDAYCKIEANRINWINQNQKQLRCDLYSGLMDHIYSNSGIEGERPGRQLILPSSFQGGPRAMQQCYQDAMAIVREFGKPDYFITFTCNPKWTEILSSLSSSERPENRPDIVARVFHLKLKEFMHDMLDKHTIGKVLAYVSVIEFQKRGLPHCHMLFLMQDEDKPRNEEQIDRNIWAEIPDRDLYPRLHQIVKTFMVHGPCGLLNENAMCMENHRCTKDFPKSFSDTTLTNVNGYPYYRRRNNGKTLRVGKHNVDNSWIVPYNPKFLLKYNAHINVEVCSTVKSVKYLHKYLYKGHDCANVQFGVCDPETRNVIDEPSLYLDARYISPPEAMWRIREFPMHSQSHKITRLAVHLEHQQPVVFKAGEELEALLNATGKQTTLTAYFELNRRDPNARSLVYPEVPKHYYFHKQESMWKPRKKQVKVISRMYVVSPSDRERYYLRLLLLHVPGATSFKHLRTVDGTECSTFHEAAKRRHLLDDDEEWDRALEEATLFQMPSKIRELFALICILNEPSNPKELWEKHKHAMMEDFLQTYSEAESENRALLDLESLLWAHGKRCVDFHLPSPPDYGIDFDNEIYNASDEARLGKEIYETFVLEQKIVFDEVMDAVEGKSNQRLFFVEGPGGSGKTYLYNALISTLRGKQIGVICVALTGLAADNMKCGRTAHSTFGIPLHINETSVSSITNKQKKSQALKDCRVVIWDECPMVSKYQLHCVERLFRDLTGNDTPFGGKIMLLGGHFAQTLPVVKKGQRTEIVENCIKSSPLWPLFKQQKLTANMRVLPEESDYCDWLVKLGNGELLNSENLDDAYVELPDEFITTDLVGEIYGTEITLNQISELTGKTILCPKNKDTLQINEQVLRLIDSPLKTYISNDSVVSPQGNDQMSYPIEFIYSLTPSGLPPHILNLKKGAIVMLLRNIHPNRGLVNGTRLVVEEMFDNLIDCKILSGSKKGDRVFLPRILLDTNDPGMPFNIRRKQYPIRLAFAITINKAQGQTLDEVGIYLPQPVFTHGQLYTAFSRARSKKKVKVRILQTPQQGHIKKNCAKVFTQNIVYKEIL